MATLLTRPPAMIMLQGELSAATRAPLESLLDEHLPAPGGDLVLDLTHVTFIDSAGLRLLTGCLRHVAATGGSMAIGGLKPEPATLLSLLGATSLFECHPDPAAAVAAIARRRNPPAT